MKKVIRWAAWASIAVLMSACCGKKLTTATYEEYLMVPMMESARDSLDIQISLEYPVGGLEDSVKVKMIENLLFAAFDEDYKVSCVDSAAVRYRNELIEEYLENQEVYSQFIKDDNVQMEGNLFRWRDYINGYFTGEEYKGLLTYVVELENDRGAAHPNNTVNATVFNKDTGEVVVESDLFKEGYQEKLSALLKDNLLPALDNDEDALQAVYPDVIGPNGNFEVGKYGITYYFNPNQIAPPMLGVIAIFVRWEEMQDILKI